MKGAPLDWQRLGALFKKTEIDRVGKYATAQFAGGFFNDPLPETSLAYRV